MNLRMRTTDSNMADPESQLNRKSPSHGHGHGHYGERQVETSLAEKPCNQVTLIDANQRWFDVNLSELWKYRDLFTLLVRRDIVGRYRQSVVGIGWAVIRPVLAMLIFTFVFSRVAGIPSDGSPYPLFAFSAMLPWLYFSGTLGSATASVAVNSHLIQKVYFPRLILPVVSVVTGMVEFLIQVVVLFLIMWWYHFSPGWQIVWAPFFIFLAALSAMAIGVWLTALNVRYRDIGQAVPFLLQAWMWLCPIVYSSQSVPENLRLVYGLNPMVGVIEGFRWSLLGTSSPDWTMVAVSSGVVLAAFITGLGYFQRVQTTFVDII